MYNYVSSTPADSTTARSIVRRNAGSGVVASGADYHIEPEATVAEVSSIVKYILCQYKD